MYIEVAPLGIGRGDGHAGTTPQVASFVGDDLYAQSLLARHELEHLKRVVGDATTVFVDEA
jgi:hypothetical protein